MFNKPPPGLSGGFVEHPSHTYAAQQSVTRFMTMTHMNLATPKGAAKCELSFNKLASEVGLLSI
jgi:hypothetical protein